MSLFNIFKNKSGSKKNETKREPKQKPKVICDIHEKNSLVIANLSKLGAEIEILPLQIADYLIGNIAIERKTAQDFISSMINKRLQVQINQMQQYEKKLLVIEGKFDLSDSKVHPNAVKGQILAIVNYYQTPIIFTKDSKETSDYLFLLAKQQIKGIQESTLHARKPQSRKEQVEYIIESFPGIGPETAKILLKKFKTVKAIINASPEELKEEIGKKADIFKIILEEYS